MFAQVLCKHVHCRLQQSRALLTNLLRYSLSAQAGFCERTPSPFEGASAISSPSFCRGSRPRDLRLSRRCCKIVDQTGSSALPSLVAVSFKAFSDLAGLNSADCAYYVCLASTSMRLLQQSLKHRWSSRVLPHFSHLILGRNSRKQSQFSKSLVHPVLLAVCTPLD